MNMLLLISTLAALAATPAQAPQASGVLDDVAKLSAATANEQRFEALTAILKARNLPFTVEPFTIPARVGSEPRTDGRNVVVSIGDGPQLIVVGAHYDAARLPDGSLSRGAVDNGASSMLLVRMADALRTEKLRTRVRFVWFDMEELGLLGSAQYLRRHADERVTAMLNFDVNGYGDTVLFGPSARAENAALRRSLVQTCAAENVPCVGYPQMPPGDDRSFVKASVPSLSIAILPAVEVHQLWLMVNAGKAAGLAQDTVPSVMRTIHTPADTPDKITEAATTTMLRFGIALVKTVAGS